MLTLIAARDRNGAIGRDNTIPWHAPEDLAFFQRETTGGAVIMGRRTWESLPFRPLKNRLNIVVSSDPAISDIVAPTPKDAIAIAYDAGHRRIYGIGGAGIYDTLLPHANRLLLTEVDLTIDGADVYFPNVDPLDWQMIGSHSLRQAEPQCVLTEYLRRCLFVA